MLTLIVMPSITLWIKLYFPDIALYADGEDPKVRNCSHVSTIILTSSRFWKKNISYYFILKKKDFITKYMGTVFNFVQGIRNKTLLHQAFLIWSHEGNSSNSVKTFSSNSKLDNSPSPLKVLKLILSADKFLVYLKQK